MDKLIVGRFYKCKATSTYIAVLKHLTKLECYLVEYIDTEHKFSSRTAVEYDEVPWYELSDETYEEVIERIPEENRVLAMRRRK